MSQKPKKYRVTVAYKGFVSYDVEAEDGSVWEAANKAFSQVAASEFKENLIEYGVIDINPDYHNIPVLKVK